MKIGLLPLYIQLYDISSPHVRPRLEAFYQNIAKQFNERGIAVETSDFCRIKPEFDQTVKAFEDAGVDAIVTLHMAYSPSLEGIEALTATKLPIIVLDTTETLEFGPQQSSDEIMYNHGIHGVMDMYSMLQRYGKPYAIAAGHYQESDVIDKACGYVKAAVAAASLAKMRVGLAGGAFKGMGDFCVPREELAERFHITVEEIEPAYLGKLRAEVTKEMLEAELAENEARFDFDESVNYEEYKEAVTDCLALRSCLKEKGYTAFSANFQGIGEKMGLDSLFFLWYHNRKLTFWR